MTNQLPKKISPHSDIGDAALNVASAAKQLSTAVSSITNIPGVDPTAVPAIAHAASALDAAASHLNAAVAATHSPSIPTVTPTKWYQIKYRRVATVSAFLTGICSGVFWVLSALNSIGPGISPKANATLTALELSIKYNWIAACFSALTAAIFACLALSE